MQICACNTRASWRKGTDRDDIGWYDYVGGCQYCVLVYISHVSNLFTLMIRKQIVCPITYLLCWMLANTENICHQAIGNNPWRGGEWRVHFLDMRTSQSTQAQPGPAVGFLARGQWPSQICSGSWQYRESDWLIIFLPHSLLTTYAVCGSTRNIC